MAQASPHILVVDDDRETRNLIAKYLRTNACNVTTATDGGGDDQRGVRLLQTFCERPGCVLSRDSLLDLTQGRNAGSFERSIDVLVSRIRRKTEPDLQEATLIKTVRSGGYLFTPTVTPVTSGAGH